MKRVRFFSGLSWLLFFNLLVKPAWIFGIDRPVQNAVGSEAYGTYFALFNLAYVLSFAADAGLTNRLNQSIAAGEAVNVPQFFRLKILLLFLYAFLCFLTGWLTGVRQGTILFYLVLIQSGSSLFLFLRGLLTAHQLFRTDALFSVLDKTLMGLLCVGPVYGFVASINLLLFLQLQAAATALSTLALLVLCFRKGFFFMEAQKQSLPRLVKATGPFLLIVLLMATHYRLDGFLLERLHGDGARQAGIYASAYRLLDAGNTVGYLCASFLVPFLARRRNEKKTVEGVVLFMRHGLLFTAIVAVTFTAVFATPLQGLLYRSSVVYNSRVMALCVAVLPAYYLVHVYGSLLTAVAAFPLFIRILVLSVLVNASLNFILIPSYGAAGCCTAALVSQYGCAALLWAFASKKCSLRFGLEWLPVYIACGIGGFFVFSAIKNSSNTGPVIFAAACFFALLFALTQKARLKRYFSVLNS